LAWRFSTSIGDTRQLIAKAKNFEQALMSLPRSFQFAAESGCATSLIQRLICRRMGPDQLTPDR
jgi:hypothetical protein